MLPINDPTRDDEEEEEPDPILRTGAGRSPVQSARTALRDLHQKNIERAVVGPPERAVRIPKAKQR